MNYGRRKILKQFGLATLGLTFGQIPLNAFSNVASNRKTKFFIMLTADGGLDVTLSLDPQEHEAGRTDQDDMFIEYTPDQILKVGDIYLAPGAEALKSFGQDILILNGISMVRDAGHESNLRYLQSGNGSGLLPNMTLHSEEMNPSPLGVLMSGKFDMAGRSAGVTELSGLSSSLAQNRLSVPEVTAIMEPEAAVTMGRLDAMAADVIREYSEIKALLPNASDQLRALLVSFKAGLTRSASLNLSSFGNSLNFDTHSNHEGTHLRSQKELFSRLTGLLEALRKTPYETGSLFDVTSVLVVSEFSRTPFRNNAKGKDHNPFTNSALLIGPDFQTGKVVGQSHLYSRSERGGSGATALHTALPIDFKTGEIIRAPQAGASLIYPEHLAKTVLNVLGVPVPPELADYAVIPGVLKT